MTLKRLDRSSVSISLVFAAQFLVFGVYIPFFPVWLSAQNRTDGEIAWLVALPLLVRVATVALSASIAERFSDPRLPIWFCLAVSIVLLAALGLMPGFWSLAAAMVVLALFWNVILPLSDALAIDISRVTGASYGRLRLWGSVAFILANLAGGAMIGAFGAWTVLPALVAGQVLALGVSVLLPGRLASQKRAERPSLFAPLSSLLRQPAFLAVLIGGGLVQASHALLYGYGSIEWRLQGFSDAVIGMFWAVGVIAEVILFAFSERVLARIGARGMLVLGGLGGVVRFALLAVSPGLAATFLVQILHAASFGLTHLGVVGFVARRAGAGETRAAQGLFAMMSGAAMGGATLLSGKVYPLMGEAGYLVMAGVAGLGLAILMAVRLTVPAADADS